MVGRLVFEPRTSGRVAGVVLGVRLAGPAVLHPTHPLGVAMKRALQFLILANAISAVGNALWGDLWVIPFNVVGIVACGLAIAANEDRFHL
jgi:hypothetical protein